MAFAIMRTAKLKGGSIAASDYHTDRLRETRNADPTKTKDNIYLIGESGDNLLEKVNETIKAAGVTKRKNAVECVEFFFGASPDYFEGDKSPTKTMQFVRKAKEFMDKQEERGMVFLKAAVHLDEKTPHIVAYAVPFDQHGKLNARAHLGGKEKLRNLQDEYAEIMEPLGLDRGVKGSKAEHQTVQKYYGKLEYMEQLERERDQAEQNKQRAQEMLERTTKLLQDEMDARKDITLRDAAKLFKNTLETTQGLAILGREKDDPVRAIITPDNKAFAPNGERISDGSSVMLIIKVANVEAPNATAAIASKYGDETAKRAVNAFGKEVAQELNQRVEQHEPERRKFDEKQLTREVEASRPREAEQIQQREIFRDRGMSR